jgi:hypothetical protein
VCCNRANATLHSVLRIRRGSDAHQRQRVQERIQRIQQYLAPSKQGCTITGCMLVILDRKMMTADQAAVAAQPGFANAFRRRFTP